MVHTAGVVYRSLSAVFWINIGVPYKGAQEAENMSAVQAQLNLIHKTLTNRSIVYL